MTAPIWFLATRRRAKAAGSSSSSGGLFWKGFNLLSETKIPENMVTERIMTRRFVDALLSMGDRNLFLGGMMSWTGFTQIGIPVAKSSATARAPTR